MTTPANSSTPSGATRRDDRRGMNAELQFLLIGIAFVIVMMLAGVPGKERRAGDGSDALQQGWAERHAAEVAAQQAGSDDATQGPDAATPDAGR